MAKILLVLVFSVVLALPFPSVLGQEDWQDLLDQGGFSQDTLDQAQKAIGGTAAQAAMEDYFGAALRADRSYSNPIEDEGEGASLADFLDTDHNTNADAGISDQGTVADSPVGAPDILPDDDDDVDSSPAGAPEGSFSPAGAPSEEASTEAPTNAPVEAPQFDDFVGGERAPTNAPSGEPDDEDEFDDSHSSPPTNAPTGAPEGGS
ncbi:unnamed protein product [Sphenostylis stenocarpa]|uniref:Uncharacterized protein n=1 Tax=Sphenostylis stenocarpa TaxID=92480 RepID=A0AA86SV00_9FABA|nr:unnamed protein product [Sphenostylis stenocarpa]